MAGGILAVMNDIAPELPEADYEAWYGHDHLPERLGVPGFRHARRYRRLDGPGPDYFTFYETDDPATLRSDAYLARLAQPSAWTRRVMPHFRAMVRTACRVEAEAGGGIVAVLAEPAGRPPATVPPERAAATLQALLARPGVTRARLWVAAEEAGAAPNPEAALRPGGDARCARFLLVEGTGEGPVLAAAAEAAAALGMAAAGAPAVHRLLVARDAAPAK